MAEARRLKSGRWRIYRGPEQAIVRDPSNGAIASFASFTEAWGWWSQTNPSEPPLQEAHKCSRCGAYFGANAPWTVVAGRPYHVAHAPKMAERREALPSSMRQ